MARIDLPDGKYLTPCEVDVLQLVGNGASSREAAGVLCVSRRAVDCRFNSIRKKLGAQTRIAALRRLEELGLAGKVTAGA